MADGRRCGWLLCLPWIWAAAITNGFSLPLDASGGGGSHLIVLCASQTRDQDVGEQYEWVEIGSRRLQCPTHYQGTMDSPWLLRRWLFACPFPRPQRTYVGEYDIVAAVDWLHSKDGGEGTFHWRLPGDPLDLVECLVMDTSYGHAPPITSAALLRLQNATLDMVLRKDLTGLQRRIVSPFVARAYGTQFLVVLAFVVLPMAFGISVISCMQHLQARQMRRHQQQIDQ